MKSKKRTIKIGDIVRLSPESQLFVRCGYPLGVRDVANQIKPADVFAVLGVIAPWILPKAGVVVDLDHNYGAPLDKLIRRVQLDLAYLKCKALGFGGTTRQIHTIAMPEVALKVSRYRVTNRKVVCTGEYNPRFTTGNNYYEDPEWVPAFLSGSQTHVIYDLTSDEGGVWNEMSVEDACGLPLRVEAKYVKLLVDAPPRALLNGGSDEE